MEAASVEAASVEAAAAAAAMAAAAMAAAAMVLRLGEPDVTRTAAPARSNRPLNENAPKHGCLFF